jgi:hypothetical protein
MMKTMTTMIAGLAAFFSVTASAQSTFDPQVLNGVFYDASAPGDGFNFVSTDDDRFFVFYYGISTNPNTDRGGQLWLISEVVDVSNYQWGETLSMVMRETEEGILREPNPNLSSWGTMTLSFEDCGRATATLDGIDGEKTMDLTRLIKVKDIPCEDI